MSQTQPREHLVSYHDEPERQVTARLQTIPTLGQGGGGLAAAPARISREYLEGYGTARRDALTILCAAQAKALEYRYHRSPLTAETMLRTVASLIDEMGRGADDVAMLEQALEDL